MYPAIPIKVSHKGKSFSLIVIVDSGADYPFLNADVAVALGIDLATCKTDAISGVGSGTAYLHDITIDIGGIEFTCTVGFMKGLPIGGLLGQVGVFDRFKVIFDYKGAEIELRPFPKP